VQVTVPLPLPVGLEVTPIHETLLMAVQLQPAGAVTVTLRAPPAAAMESEVGETVKLHDAPGACVTVTVWPAMVSVPVRDAAPLLAATL
jgi:hypothetical protein